MKRRGFTLMELMVVISMIAVLAAILFPVFARAREQARKTNCANNLHQVGVALQLYARDNNGHFPKKNNDYVALYPYAKNTDVFCCPSDANDRTWETKNGKTTRAYSSYVIKGGLTNDDRADMIIAGEAQVWHGEMVNVLYLGGDLKYVPADIYKPVVPQTQLPPPTQSPSSPAPSPSMIPPPAPGGG